MEMREQVQFAVIEAPRVRERQNQSRNVDFPNGVACPRDLR